MSDINQIKKKIERFCAFRERCVNETETRLTHLGALPNQVKELIQWLIKENFLNEERFAHSFARSKFNQNKWGKRKIFAELTARDIDKQLIESALLSIDSENYTQKALSLARKKWDSLSKTNHDVWTRKQKTAAFLVSKGFEMEFACNVVNEVSETI